MRESEMRDKIVNFLRQNGPSHPVQIGKVLGKDGLMTSAILSEVIKEGSVKRTERNVGNSPLYFIAGQEEASKKMVMENLGLVEKKVVEKIKKTSFVFHSDLTTQDKFVMSGLKDFLLPLKVKLGDKETIIWKYYDVPNDKILPSLTEKLKSLEEKEVPKKEKPPSKESIFDKKEIKAPVTEETEPVYERPSPSSRFHSRVEEWFSENSMEILEREVKRKGKEMEYFIKISGPVEQIYFVKCKDKKRVSESDISLTYTEAMQKKLPAIFITSGKVSKKILSSIEKKFGNLVKIVVV